MNQGNYCRGPAPPLPVDLQRMYAPAPPVNPPISTMDVYPKNDTKTSKWKRVVIDSRTRDPVAYPSPNKYTVVMEDDLENVKSMRLVVADIPFSSYLIGSGAAGAIPIKFGNYSTTAQLPRGDYYGPQDMTVALATSIQTAANSVAGTSAPIFGAAYIPRTDNFAITSTSTFSIHFASKLETFVQQTTPVPSPARVIGFSPNSSYVSSNQTLPLGTLTNLSTAAQWSASGVTSVLENENLLNMTFKNQTNSYQSSYAAFSNSLVSLMNYANPTAVAYGSNVVAASNMVAAYNYANMLSTQITASNSSASSNDIIWASNATLTQTACNLAAWAPSAAWGSNASLFASSVNTFLSSATNFATTSRTYAGNMNTFGLLVNNWSSNVNNYGSNSSTLASLATSATTQAGVTSSNAASWYNSSWSSQTASIMSSLPTWTADSNAMNWIGYATQTSNYAANVTDWLNTINSNWFPVASSTLQSGSNLYVNAGTWIAGASTQNYVSNSHAIIAPYRRDFRSDRFVILNISPNAELLTSISQPIDRTFAVIPRGTYTDLNINNTRDAFEKKWSITLGRIGQIGVTFTDAYGQAYDFQNQDHRLEFLFECVGYPIP